MTVVTPQLRLPVTPDRRQTDILESVHGTFVEKGFDGASMQDLARAAGMSVGNFYRYFESKEAIIEALIAFDIARIEQDFALINESDRPMDALRATIRRHMEESSCNQDGKLWAEITAVALRKDRVADVLSGMESAIRGYMLGVFGRVTGFGPDEVERRYSGHAALVVMLVKSSVMCPPTRGTPVTDLNTLVLRMIDGVLGEIETDAVKG